MDQEEKQKVVQPIPDNHTSESNTQNPSDYTVSVVTQDSELDNHSSECPTENRTENTAFREDEQSCNTKSDSSVGTGITEDDRQQGVDQEASPKSQLSADSIVEKTDKEVVSHDNFPEQISSDSEYSESNMPDRKVNKKQDQKKTGKTPNPKRANKKPDQSKAKQDQRSSTGTKKKEPTPKQDWPTTLAEFGYKFGNDGVLVSENGSQFNFAFSEDHALNQARYEAIGEVITKEVYTLLENSGNLKKINIPASGKKPHSFVFASEDYLSNEKMLILIHGSGVVRAGQWTRKLIINNSLDHGTQLPYILSAQTAGYSVLVLNPNHNKVRDSKGTEKSIPNHENPESHARYVWEHIVKKSKAKKIAIVAHSYGGVVTVDLARAFSDDFVNRVFAVAFTDSVHSAYRLPRKAKAHFSKVAINWCTSMDARDTCLGRYPGDALIVSAGHTQHEWTSWAAHDSVFLFLKEMEEKGIHSIGVEEAVEATEMTCLDSAELAEARAHSPMEACETDINNPGVSTDLENQTVLENKREVSENIDPSAGAMSGKEGTADFKSEPVVTNKMDVSEIPVPLEETLSGKQECNIELDNQTMFVDKMEVSENPVPSEEAVAGKEEGIADPKKQTLPSGKMEVSENSVPPEDLEQKEQLPNASCSEAAATETPEQSPKQTMFVNKMDVSENPVPSEEAVAGKEEGIADPKKQTLPSGTMEVSENSFPPEDLEQKEQLPNASCSEAAATETPEQSPKQTMFVNKMEVSENPVPSEEAVAGKEEGIADPKKQTLPSGTMEVSENSFPPEDLEQKEQLPNASCSEAAATETPEQSPKQTMFVNKMEVSENPVPSEEAVVGKEEGIADPKKQTLPSGTMEVSENSFPPEDLEQKEQLPNASCSEAAATETPEQSEDSVRRSDKNSPKTNPSEDQLGEASLQVENGVENQTVSRL